MIKFKKKEFVLPAVIGTAVKALGGPLMTGSMVAGTGISAYQGHKQGKEMEKQGAMNQEAMEKQAELMKQQNRQLSKIAERVKTNPSAAGEISNILATKSYSSIMPFVKSVAGAVKKGYGKSFASNATMAASMGLGTYAAGKFIQKDMKKNNLDIDQKSGMLVNKNYSIGAKALSTMKAVGNYTKKNWKKVGGGLAGGTAFGALPLALGYVGDKQQAKGQLENTNPQIPVQRQYSVIGGLLKTVGSKIARSTKPIRTHPMQTITGGISYLASFGMSGTKNNYNAAVRLQTLGKKNGSQLAEKTGKWLANHKTAANALSIVPGAAVATATFDGLDKGVNKIGSTIDPGAYKYKNVKDKQLQA